MPPHLAGLLKRLYGRYKDTLQVLGRAFGDFADKIGFGRDDSGNRSVFGGTCQIQMQFRGNFNHHLVHIMLIDYFIIMHPFTICLCAVFVRNQKVNKENISLCQKSKGQWKYLECVGDINIHSLGDFSPLH